MSDIEESGILPIWWLNKVLMLSNSLPILYYC